jgi:hypothetical protein
MTEVLPQVGNRYVRLLAQNWRHRCQISWIEHSCYVLWTDL